MLFNFPFFLRTQLGMGTMDIEKKYKTCYICKLFIDIRDTISNLSLSEKLHLCFMSATESLSDLKVRIFNSIFSKIYHIKTTNMKRLVD